MAENTPTSRQLAVAHQEAIERERSAWDWLQHAQQTGDALQRAHHLRDWTAARAQVREAQELLTRRMVQEARSNFRDWLGEPLAQPTAGSPPVDAGQILRTPHIPSRGQKLRARDGAIWLIEELAVDQLEPGHFLAQVTRFPSDGGPQERREVYGDDWPMTCLVYGLKPA